MQLELRAVGAGATGACRPGKGHWRVLSTGGASSLILFLKSSLWLLCEEPG